jgi:hypothetical protein
MPMPASSGDRKQMDRALKTTRLAPNLALGAVGLNSLQIMAFSSTKLSKVRGSCDQHFLKPRKGFCNQAQG